MLVTGPILALDLATNTGWCVGAPGGVPVLGTEKLPSTADDVGAFISAYNRWLLQTLCDTAPALVIYEQPSIFSKTTPATVIKLNGLASHTELVCHDHVPRLKYRQVNPSRLKKFWTGNGRAEKSDMVAMARRYGFAVTDDNQADAVSAWCYAVFCYAAPEHRRRFEGGPLAARPLVAEASAA